MADGWHFGLSREEFTELRRLHDHFILDLMVWYEDDRLLPQADCDQCGASVQGFPVQAARRARVLCPLCMRAQKAHLAIRTKLESRDDCVTPETAFESMRAAVETIMARSRALRAPVRRERESRGVGDTPERKEAQKRLQAAREGRPEKGGAA